MRDELLQTFDHDGRPAEIAPRSRVHREGLWHCAASVFLFRSDGCLIVQRRQWIKDVCPGAWDLSVAEHLMPGESYEQAALRGLQEELGVERVALRPLGDVTCVQLDLADRGIKDYELQLSFRGVFDGELHPNPAEVAEVDAVRLSDLREALVSRPETFTPWFRDSVIRLAVCDA